MRFELLPPPSPLARDDEPRERALDPLLALALFVATLVATITLGGAWARMTRSDVAPGVLPLLTPATVSTVWSDPELLASGLAFALPTLFILLCHEAGHWLACRRHGIAATLPLFLPAPIGLGTFGAFIQIRGAIRSRRQLLDVGVWGPIAGFAALLPFLVLGTLLSEPSAPSEALASASTVPRLRIGENLLLTGATRLFHGQLAPGVALNPHPFLLAAWVGCCATMLNLLPLGRLDGGHVAHAVSSRFHRRLRWPLWIGLVALGALWRWWWLWAALVLALGLRHPRVADESEPLDPPRRALAFGALVLLALTFVPIPLRIEPGAGEPGRSARRGQVEDERHRTVVDQFDGHARAEASAGDAEAALAETFGQELDQRRRLVAGRGALERRPPAAVERGEERELGDEQNGATRSGEIEVHLASAVVEDAESRELLGGGLDDSSVVTAFDADEREEAALDRADLFAVHRDPRAGDPLQDETHRFRP